MFIFRLCKYLPLEIILITVSKNVTGHCDDIELCGHKNLSTRALTTSTHLRRATHKYIIANSNGFWRYNWSLSEQYSILCNALGAESFWDCNQYLSKSYVQHLAPPCAHLCTISLLRFWCSLTKHFLYAPSTMFLPTRHGTVSLPFFACHAVRHKMYL